MRKNQHLYWSRLKKYESCGLNYLWSYGHPKYDLGQGYGKRRIPPIKRSEHHALMGTVIQYAIEMLYNNKLYQKHLFDQKSLQQELLKHMDEMFQQEQRRRFLILDEMSVDEMREICVSGVMGYLETMKHQKLIGSYNQAEERLTGALPDGTLIGGIADLVYRLHGDYIILDGKNSKAKGRYLDADQLRWYALCFRLVYGFYPKKLGYVWYRFPYNEEKEETGVSWVDFGRRDMTRLEERASRVRNLIQEGEKFRANPSKDNCRFCDFASVCEAKKEYDEAAADESHQPFNVTFLGGSV
jgi:hypothetical protein